MTVDEKTTEKYLKKRVEALGGMCIKFTAPGTVGVPDRIVILSGMTVFVEIKKKGERPRATQVKMFTKMMAAGAFVFLVDSNEAVDEFIAFMAEPEKKAEPVIQLLNS